MNPISLWPLILATTHCEDRWEHIMQYRMFMNVIGRAKAWWYGKALCTMADHCFTSLNVIKLHRSGIAIWIFWIIFVFFKGAVDPDFLFIGDIASPNRTVAVPDTLECNNLEHMTCAAHINPIDPFGKLLQTGFWKNSPCTNCPRTENCLGRGIRQHPPRTPQ